MRLAAAPTNVKPVLDLSHLSGVFETCDPVDAARIAAWPWRTVRIVVAGGGAGQRPDLSAMLMADGSAVTSVTWEHPKRERG